MDIAKRIKEIREEKELKQFEVADKMGIEPPQYNRYEKRNKKLTIEQLEDIAGALGVTIKDILFEEESTPNERELEYLKRELEFAEREIELLKREMELLKRELKNYEHSKENFLKVREVILHIAKLRVAMDKQGIDFYKGFQDNLPADLVEVVNSEYWELYEFFLMENSRLREQLKKE